MPLSSSAEDRFLFPKAERLRHRRAFDYLFEHGSSLRVGMLTFFYATDCPPQYVEAALSVAFAAPKRAFKRAVDRNYLKRRMREAYRLQKYTLLSLAQKNEKNLILLVKYNSRKKLPYAKIEHSIGKGLSRIQRRIFPTQEE